jgi:hypothetical protein
MTLGNMRHNGVAMASGAGTAQRLMLISWPVTWY